MATLSIAIVGTAFLACGLTVTGSPSEPGNPASTESSSNPASSGGGTSAGAPEPPESRASTFACGASATCNVGVDICCEETPGAFACRAISAGGCPSPPDGGPSTSAALACTTYNACPNSDDCCYNPTTRTSACKSQCSNGEDRLCRLGGMDRCGQNSECEQMNNPPAPGIGECRPNGGGGSSNGYPGGSSNGGYPGGGSSSRGW